MKRALQTWLSQSRLPRPVLHAGLAVPLAVLLWDIWTETHSPGLGLGANPAEAIVKRLGEDGINILLITLGVSSVSRVAGIPQLIRFRRMVGLWAFTYLLLHLSGYLVFLAGLDWSVFLVDLGKRPYILAGMSGIVMLVPLAVTSTRGWQRRLGRRWKILHMLVYPAVMAGWIHVFWQVRASYFDAVFYGVIVAILLGERIVSAVRKRKRVVQASKGT